MAEIEIDTKEFDEVARSEFEKGVDDISVNGPLHALSGTRERLAMTHNETLGKSEESIACKNGCWYCCYYKVDVRADELFKIVEYIRREFTIEQLQKIRGEVANNAKIMKNMTHDEQLAANIKCVFLSEQSCSIYPVRPEKCRTFHARDMDGCKASYEQPHNFDIPNSFHPELFTLESGHTEGYKYALEQSGYDASYYEMNTALSMCISDSAPKVKWLKKKRPFPSKYVRV